MSNYCNRHEAHTCLGGDIDFIIDGVPAINFGLHFAPDNKDYVSNNPSDRNVNIQDLSSAKGGSMFFGSNIKAKEFTLRTWYWIDDVKSGFLFDVNTFYSVGKKHTLYFSDTPWIIYDIVITKTTNEPYSMISGLYTITCTACSGSGKYRNPSLASGSALYENFINNTGYFRQMPEEKYPSTEITITGQTEFNIYNPGSVETPIVIEYTGTNANGLSIYNKTNGKLLELRACTTSSFTSPYTKLVMDSESGKMYMSDSTGTATKLAFMYHYSGLLTLAPCDKIDIGDLQHIKNDGYTHYFTCTVPLYDNVIGKYLAFVTTTDYWWMKITAVSWDGEKTTITATATSTKYITTTGEPNRDTKIVTMNEFIVTPTSTANCTLKINSTPRF